MHLYFFPQQIPKAVLPLSPTISTYLLSEHVQREMGEDGQQRFRLRMLFHQMGDSSTQRTCVTLHAFRETEEQKASCITQVRRRVNRVHPIRGLIQTGIPFDIYILVIFVSQPPLGLCVVTLMLPGSWFMDRHRNRSHQELHIKSHNSVRLRSRLQRRRWRSGGHPSSRFVRHWTLISAAYGLDIFWCSFTYDSCRGALVPRDMPLLNLTVTLHDMTSVTFETQIETCLAV